MKSIEDILELCEEAICSGINNFLDRREQKKQLQEENPEEEETPHQDDIPYVER